MRSTRHSLVFYTRLRTKQKPEASEAIIASQNSSHEQICRGKQKETPTADERTDIGFTLLMTRKPEWRSAAEDWQTFESACKSEQSICGWE